MSYIGNQPTQVAFLTDTFSGTGSATAFTMSVAPANSASVLVAISGVVQAPSTYSVSGTTLTFSSAPASGTGNISCRYLGIPASGVTNTAYRTVTEFTATAGQTTFTPPSYTAGFINVFRNGVLLGSADYTATNGTTVVLNTGATLNDLITIESFQVGSVTNAIPATTGSVGSTYLAPNIALTSPTLTSATFVTPASSIITSGTAVASTSGTSITFTGIPSWTKRITMIFSGVSTNGTAAYLVQVGSGSLANSGYVSYAAYAGGVGATGQNNSTAGYIIWNNTAGALMNGSIRIYNLTGNVWVADYSFGATVSGSYFMFGGGGNITLSGVLDRVGVTTVTGTPTFSSGSINIQYE